ncbi:MAG: 2-amino-4-hydroxy-6-hydroxymethyldihydropteridine pyrophosphokinae [Thermomicrobiales bacterium]|nr:2-amino-4-hydroxy-6-hydroxymethyldihydropteridine pyrophosphokinae [Thermomicrobiales bacterium]
MATAYIALGSNLGDRMTTLGTAVQRLESLGRVTRVSSLYQTEPVGYLEQPRFLNAVVALETALAPIDLLHALLGIERDLGRMRTFPNAPRTVDLDLVLVDDVILDTTELTLPHLRLHERASRRNCPGGGASSVWKDDLGSPRRTSGSGWCRGLRTRRLGACPESSGVARGHSARRRRNVSGSFRKSRVSATCSRSSQATRRGVPPSRL